MKKICVLILLAVMLLVSCESESLENDIIVAGTLLSEGEFVSSEKPFYRVDDVFYGAPMCGQFPLLVSFDVNSGETRVLCGKEGCEHNNLDCGAFIQSIVFGLAPDGGKIRWISGEENKLQLYEINADGTDKHAIAELSEDSLFSLNRNISVLYFHDSIYYSGVVVEYKNNKPVQTVRLGREDLSGSDGGEILLEKTYSYIPYVFSFVGNDSIYTIISSDEEHDKEKSKPKLEVYKVTDDGKKVKIIYRGACPIYAWKADMYGGDIYLSEFIGTRVYKFETTKKELSFVYDFSEKYAGFDTSYVSGGKMIAGSTENGLRYVMDYNGNEILYSDYSEFEDMLKEGSGFLGRYFIGADNNYIFYSYCDETKYAAIPLSGEEPILIFDAESIQ